MHGTVVSEVVATGTPLLQGPAHGYACLMRILNAHLLRLFLNLFDKALYIMTTHVRSIMSVVILVLSELCSGQESGDRQTDGQITICLYSRIKTLHWFVLVDLKILAIVDKWPL